MADFFELLATRLEFFVDLDGLFGHLRVRVLRAADQRKIRPGGKPFVAVGIQPDPENHCFVFFLFAVVGHGRKLKAICRSRQSRRNKGGCDKSPAFY